MIGNFKEVAEAVRNRFADSPLGKQLGEMDTKAVDKIDDSSLAVYARDVPESESTEPKSEGSTNEEKPKIFEIPMPETQEPLETISLEKLIPTSDFIPRTGGEWDGEAGDSKWYPNRDTEPGDRNGTNPEHKTWGEILDKYKIDGISFHNGEPDFSEISKGNVEIDDFTDSRDSNFDQADEKLAKQRGCTPEEVAEWRKENGYTWHECSDRKTMQKVPTEVHGNIPHSGGISEQKSKSQDT